MSPVLLRPIREQFEHNRVIRLLQVRLRRRYVVGMNLEDEREATGVRSGTDLVYPDLVLTNTTGARRLHGVVEIETAESVNRLEAMAEWVRFGKVRGAFYLYVPAGTTDIALQLCGEYAIGITEIWSYLAVGDQMRFTMTYRSARAEARARREAASGAGTSTGAKKGAASERRAKAATPAHVESARRTAKPAKRAAAKPAKRTAKPAKRTAKPAKRAAKPAKRTAKPAKRAAKPAKRTAKPAKRAAAKPAKRTAKAGGRAAKTAAATNRATTKTATGAKGQASSNRKTSSRAGTSAARIASKAGRRSTGARTKKAATTLRRSRKHR